MIMISYLKDRIKILLMLILFTFVFAVIFYLYSIPLMAVLYATLLCFCFGVIIAIFDFCKYVKKHKKLMINNRYILDGVTNLPTVDTLIEKDYQQLIENLCLENNSIISKNDERFTDMVDYYTLWVHQIKTPISTMSILLQQKEEINRGLLADELFKIERYVELVLQYLRLESINSDLKLENYKLQKIINQAVKKYAPLFIRKKIRIEIEDMELAVLTDEKWMCFVLEQILSNSLKYMSEGTIKIYLEQSNTLVIEDSGIGISEEDLPRVFEKGFTGYNGRMDKKSTGIGLYLCNKITRRLSHKIEITSQLNSGTKVMITFLEEKVV
ncbi:MAG: sensor histidine kinase [Lachnospiraceae bacterium]|nr:sensor histidine kinase [Lachnospiraceae bacterium]